MSTLEISGVTEDFPKLIKTLASFKNKEFDYWDDLMIGVYKKSMKEESSFYFESTQWVMMNNQHYPLCPSMERDWNYLEGRYVINTKGTKYIVDQNKLKNSKLGQYVDSAVPALI